MAYYYVPWFGADMLFNIFKHLRNNKNISERSYCELVGISRGNLRKIEMGDRDIRLNNLEKLSASVERELVILPCPKETPISDDSIVAISLLILRDGFDSWKIHLMNFVDQFRLTLDPRLIILPPVTETDVRLKSLFASTVSALCDSIGAETPSWARKIYFLNEPWFVSGIENLKASTILESPLQFRKNNIFVQENFLVRK